MEHSGSRQRRSEETIARIFEATEKLIVTVGSARLTVRDICRESDTTVGSFYHHFEDKADLMCCYGIGKYREFLAHHPFCPRPEEEFVESLLAFLTDYSRFCAEMGAEFMQTVYLAHSRSIVRAVEYDLRFTNVLAAAAKKGLLGCSPEQLSQDIRLVHGGMIARWSLNDNFDLPEATERILRNYLQSAAAQKHS